MKTVLMIGVLALAALAIPSASASTVVPPPCVAPCLSACHPFHPGGGVVGDTETYANDLATITCTTATEESAWAATTATNACNTTTQFLMGSSCSICTTCATPTPAGGLPVPAVVAPSAAMASGVIVIRCGGISGGGGIVGATVTYAGTMEGQACAAALSQAGIALGAAIAACNATGEYATGSGGMCTIYITM